MKILISGVGIAGTTLAYWLTRYGFAVTLVEVSNHLRTGGYIIDFWGAGFDVAEKMGLLPQLMQRGYRVTEVRFVEMDGHRVGGFRFESLARILNDRFISLPRGELAAAVFASLEGKIETLFDDEIAALESDEDGVRVSFKNSPQQTFDLVIGAGGLHSKVRSLVFGPEPRFARYLGYKVAAFNVPFYAPRDELVYVSYGRAGLQASRFALKDGSSLILLVTADEHEAVPDRLREQKAYLHARFDDAGWECSHIMAEMDRCDRLYLDAVTQIDMESWSKGRIALIGDAAFCPSLLAGEGASLAMTAAYVLAGELHAADGAYAPAFARYEAALRPLMHGKQKAARQFASSFAPKTEFGIVVRNWITKAMAIPRIARVALGATLRDDFVLPDYEAIALHVRAWEADPRM